MKPKPPPAQHREALVRVLGAALNRQDARLDGWLDHAPHAFTLVSWTSLLYTERRDIALDLPGIEQLLARPEPSPDDIGDIDRLGRHFERAWHLFGDSFPFLTRIVASDALQETLAEVHRYLDDRGGIAGRIRQLVREPLVDAWRAGARVLLVGHSLGSVIAYDTLWELSRGGHEPGEVDLFLSLGSPIATRFIRLQLKGAGLSGPERYPGNIRRWLNVAARGELVALQARIAPFFKGMAKLDLLESLVDRQIYNHFRGPQGELDVHKSYGYLHHPVVAAALAGGINGDGPGG